MQKFAFIIHPIDAKRDVARSYPIAKYLPERVVEEFIKHKFPITVAEVSGVKSLTGEELQGWLIACPLTPRQLISLPPDFVLKRLEQCGMIAQELGAGILGLGAFTAIVGDGGITLAQRLPGIAITTGNSYTVATAIQGAKKAAALMGHQLEQSQVAVVGATGSIGRTCAEVLAREAASIVLVGRDETRLNRIAADLRDISCGDVLVSTSVPEGLKNADVVITVTSAVDAVIQPSDIKIGAVVCDVSRPRDVSTRVVKERNDVLVIEGGIVQVPGNMVCKKPGRDEQFSFGFPPGTAYACMSETMMLALDARYENFTLGKEVTVAQVDETERLAAKHGFQLSGFRSFEKEVSEDTITRVHSNACKKQELSPLVGEEKVRI